MMCSSNFSILWILVVEYSYTSNLCYRSLFTFIYLYLNLSFVSLTFKRENLFNGAAITQNWNYFLDLKWGNVLNLLSRRSVDSKWLDPFFYQSERKLCENSAKGNNVRWNLLIRLGIFNYSYLFLWFKTLIDCQNMQ